MTKILRMLIVPKACPHRGAIVMTTTHSHGRTICDACGHVFAEWRRHA